MVFMSLHQHKSVNVLFSQPNDNAWEFCCNHMYCVYLLAYICFAHKMTTEERVKKLLRSHAHNGAHRQTQTRCSLASLYFILYIYFHRCARTMKENFSGEPLHVSNKLYVNAPIRRNTSKNWDDEISIQLRQPAAVVATITIWRRLRASSSMSTRKWQET